MTEKSKILQAVRAQAILFVLIFHLRPNFLPNGYLGVDMFFVLSGYLITKILSISALDKQSVDVRLFYEKRIKRIIPLYM
ncbi:unnamed protein product, partial [Mesorhabditis belari]|uniref:Acyltransferase 3 domain-containing protein n=1 Tax=Mesorhabditis belari TaxID=2138241 RepID=A0AAF3EH14_9BILA